jgi:hypothetical protein
LPAKIEPSRSWFVAAWSELRAHSAFAACISIMLLLPCFWTFHIQAGDLASHLYNSWLVQLIHQGKAPGLWLAHPCTNVLLDYGLAFLLPLIGPWAAEHIAVGLSVLLFFWSEVALIWTLNRRVPKSLLPILAALAYGFVFQAGFFNYYISLGIAFYLLAVVWHGHLGDWIGFALGLAIAFLAHPIPSLWVVAASFYVYLARGRNRGTQWLLFLAALSCIVAARGILTMRYQTTWSPDQLWNMTGADQVAVFGRTGWLLAFALLTVWCLMLFRGNPEWRQTLVGSPAQLFYICAAMIVILPGNILISPERSAWFGAGPPRISLIAAVLICVLVSAVKPLKWHIRATGAVAIVFFLLLYANHRELDRIETEIRHLVQQLPPEQRVLAFFPWQETGERDPRFVYRLETAFERVVSGLPFGEQFNYVVPRERIDWATWHLIDRACLGQCFSFGNYEPYSGEFRVRASPGNRIVNSDGNAAWQLGSGSYRALADDLPLYLVYRCRTEPLKLCLRPMSAGETLDSATAPGSD